MINRVIEERLIDKVDYKKAIVLLGPRQVGKTTLVKKIAGQLDPKYLYVNGDDPTIQLLWSKLDLAGIKAMTSGQKVIVIDEAQRINNIGLIAKMIIDLNQDIQLFISGSSALELSSIINEPMTGRKWEFRLYPISFQELVNELSLNEALTNIENYLITGTYPEVINNPNHSREVLSNLAGSYLYKDILELAGIRKPELLLKILQALAWQVGNEVSYNELAQTVGADKNTVSNYIDLLEKVFVIFRLNPLSRNLRNEINSSRKIYFYDNGIRNTIINNYAPLIQRNDVGQLWENFMVSEFKKRHAYKMFFGNSYFWRSKDKAEIDYLVESDGTFKTYEIKWNPSAKPNFPQSFLKAYNPIENNLIHRENFWKYLCDF